MSDTAIAINRFGLGAKPNQNIVSNPQQWLLHQLKVYQANSSAWQTHETTETIVAAFYQRKQKTMGSDKAAKQSMRKAFNQDVRKRYRAAVNMRLNSALQTDTPFVERLVHFWANHFAVSADNPRMRALVSRLEVDAIRPHVLGDFKTMLMAVEQHPAMLVYLNQVNSIGPNSKVGLRANKKKPERNRGLNENLAREIMELHTLGVRSGYTQDDVIALAKALTGWSVDNGKLGQRATKGKHGFVFRTNIHEPGSRKLLGKHYAASGLSQAELILSDLALSRHTAKHIAIKLARHFVADHPPEALIKQLTDTFMRTQGDLSSVYKTLIAAPEAWQAAPAKFKTPWEWTVSALRGLGVQQVHGNKVMQGLQILGQPVWKPGSPAGYADTSAAWVSPNALLRRVEIAQRIAKSWGAKLDSRRLAPDILLGALSDETKTAIERSESAQSGLALLLVSPEFLRR